jgi:hypothetical protein
VLYKSKIALNGKLLSRKPRLYQRCSAEEEEEEQEEKEEEDGHAVLQIINIIFRIMRAQDSNTVFHTAFFQSSNSKG